MQVGMHKLSRYSTGGTGYGKFSSKQTSSTPWSGQFSCVTRVLRVMHASNWWIFTSTTFTPEVLPSIVTGGLPEDLHLAKISRRHGLMDLLLVFVRCLKEKVMLFSVGWTFLTSLKLLPGHCGFLYLFLVCMIFLATICRHGNCCLLGVDYRYRVNMIFYIELTYLQLHIKQCV